MTSVYIPVEVNDDLGQHDSVADVVFTTLEGAVGWLTSKTVRAELRPSAKVSTSTRKHPRFAAITTVETPDWKLGYVITARLSK